MPSRPTGSSSGAGAARGPLDAVSDPASAANVVARHDADIATRLKHERLEALIARSTRLDHDLLDPLELRVIEAGLEDRHQPVEALEDLQIVDDQIGDQRVEQLAHQEREVGMIRVAR